MKTIRITWSALGQSGSVRVPEFELGNYIESLRDRIDGPIRLVIEPA